MPHKVGSDVVRLKEVEPFRGIVAADHAHHTNRSAPDVSSDCCIDTIPAERPSRVTPVRGFDGVDGEVAGSCHSRPVWVVGRSLSGGLGCQRSTYFEIVLWKI